MLFLLSAAFPCLIPGDLKAVCIWRCDIEHGSSLWIFFFLFPHVGETQCSLALGSWSYMHVSCNYRPWAIRYCQQVFMGWLTLPNFEKNKIIIISLTAMSSPQLCSPTDEEWHVGLLITRSVFSESGGWPVTKTASWWHFQPSPEDVSPDIAGTGDFFFFSISNSRYWIW